MATSLSKVLSEISQEISKSRVLPRVHYILEPLLFEDADQNSLISMYDSLKNRDLGDDDPLLYFVWALRHTAQELPAKKLENYLKVPLSPHWRPPSTITESRRILMRAILVKLDTNEYMRNERQYGVFISNVILHSEHIGKRDRYPHDDCEARMNLYRRMEQSMIITPDNMEFLLKILNDIGNIQLQDTISTMIATYLQSTNAVKLPGSHELSSSHIYNVQPLPGPLVQYVPQPLPVMTPNDEIAGARYRIFEAGKEMASVYSLWPDIPSGDFFSPWPKINNRTRYITLALVTNHSVTRDDDFTHRTLRQSEDDIPKHKFEVSYENVFPLVMPSHMSQVLISGRPGSGKTVLLTKVSKDWAKGSCLTNFSALFHVSLRELISKSDQPGLADVVSLFFSSSDRIREVTNAIDKVNGEGVCFALDGLDEYPNRDTSWDFIMCLIKKTKLPLSSVIITSRPSATSSVPTSIMSCHIEIVGFSQEQVEEYINEYYVSISEPNKARELLGYLDTHPNVKDMCYLPLHLAMIIYVNQYKTSKTLPETESEVYVRFVTHSIVRYVRREKKDEENVDVETFSDMKDYLNDDELQLFNSICFLAFEMKVRSRLIFSARDIKNNFPYFTKAQRDNLTKNGLGIISHYAKKVETGIDPHFSFQHLTIQEFLGAYHISQMDVSQHLNCLNNHGYKIEMREMWRFFCGLVKSSSHTEKYFNELIKLNPLHGGDTLFLIRCIFEAQGSCGIHKICESLLSSRKGVLNVSNIILYSPDCSAIGHMISQSPDDLKQLLMNYCQVGPGGIMALNYQLNRYNVETFINIWNMQIRSQYNPLGNEGGTPLTDILHRMINLCELRLYGNQLRSDKLTALQPIISRMINLRVLVLTRNSLGPDCGEVINKILYNLSNLIQFYVSYNPIGTKGLQDALPGLLRCKQLQRLGLRDCNLDSNAGKLLSTVLDGLHDLRQLELYWNQLGDEGVAEMAESLKYAQHLEQVSFTKNNIGDEGGCMLAEVLKATQSLKQMRVYYNEVSYKSRLAFYNARQYRLRNGLHEVKYAI